MAKDKAGFQMIEFYLGIWLACKKLNLIGWILKTNWSEPTEIYSELAEEYFKTPPKERTSIIEKIINEK